MLPNGDAFRRRVVRSSRNFVQIISPEQLVGIYCNFIGSVKIKRIFSFIFVCFFSSTQSWLEFIESFLESVQVIFSTKGDNQKNNKERDIVLVLTVHFTVIYHSLPVKFSASILELQARFCSNFIVGVCFHLLTNFFTL